MKCCRVSNSIIEISGHDVLSWLQGLVTNDVTVVSAERSVYALLLNHQGRYVGDFFVFQVGDSYYLECNGCGVDELVEILSKYVLRAEISMRVVDDELEVMVVFCAPEDLATSSGILAVYQDTRFKAKGVDVSRVVLDPCGSLVGFEEVHMKFYDSLRIENLIPSGDKDLIRGNSLPAEYGIYLLGGISMSKGCYLGQEVTSKMIRMGLTKRKLYMVQGKTLPHLCDQMYSGGEHVGMMLSSVDDIGLALIHTGYLSSLKGSGVVDVHEDRFGDIRVVLS